MLCFDFDCLPGAMDELFGHRNLMIGSLLRLILSSPYSNLA
jgi:hypothetical protein